MNIIIRNIIQPINTNNTRSADKIYLIKWTRNLLQNPSTCCHFITIFRLFIRNRHTIVHNNFFIPVYDSHNEMYKISTVVQPFPSLSPKYTFKKICHKNMTALLLVDLYYAKQRMHFSENPLWLRVEKQKFIISHIHTIPSWWSKFIEPCDL